MAIDVAQFTKAPIPGENLTVDSSGYPWRRPPQVVEFDDAYEWVVDNVFSDGEVMDSAFVAMANGISAMSLTEVKLLGMVSKGVISPDTAIMLAGPFYKTFTAVAKAANIRHLTGFDSPEELKSFAKYLEGEDLDVGEVEPKKPTEAQKKQVEKAIEEGELLPPSTGLMGAGEPEEPAMDIPADTGTGMGGLVAPPAEEQETPAEPGMEEEV